jgi:hypothetical protein
MDWRRWRQKQVSRGAPGSGKELWLTIMMIEEKGQNNLAFACRLQLGEADACVDLLLKTDRASEAAFFARTYAPRCVLPSHLPSLPIAHSIVSSYLAKYRRRLKLGVLG